MPDDRGAAPPVRSVEGRASWAAAGATLVVLSVAYGLTLLIVVGLRAMERGLGLDRSVLALAGAPTWVGTGLGGVLMGRVADRSGCAPPSRSAPRWSLADGRWRRPAASGRSTWDTAR